jgi:aspartyl-tRNA(Asn)/glutamyl-tRNA(Gln) amidotransferase subunit A
MRAAQDTITVLNAKIKQGRLTHEDLVMNALKRASGPAATAVLTKIYPEAALAAARAADAQKHAGVELHPLAGMPVTVKDLYDIAGETTLAGSLACRLEAPALADAPSVARLRGHGAAILGKTNMTEFAFSGVGINPHFGTPRNPWDAQVDRIPGGSSSGAAVSVALGLAVAGLGSDTGGSIRIPAALNGLVGFKCTQGRVSRAGAFELARSLDTVCAMTNSVDDCLLVDAVLANRPLRIKRRPLSALRLAVPQTLMLDELEPEVAQAFARSLSQLSKAGAAVIDVPLPQLAEVAQLNQPGGLSPIEAYAVHVRRMASSRALYDPRVAARIDLGATISAQEYLALLDRRHDWIQRMEKALSGYDAVLCPTVPMVAPALQPLIDSDALFLQANARLLRNTFLFNFLDGCSFSLPCHAEGKMPVGLMLSSVSGDDAGLANVALEIEAALALM